MIQEARFEEFRALRSLRVSFERLTVLVGPNGSGKSSILEGIHYLLQIALRPLQQVLAGPWRPDRLRNTRASGPMKLGLSFGGPAPGSLELLVTPVDAGEDSPPYQARMQATVRAEARQWNPEEALLRDQGALFLELSKETAGALFLRLSPRALAAPSYADTEEPVLGHDGEGLASVMAELATREPELKEAITEALRRVVPGVRRIRTERAAVVRAETEYITVGTERVPLRRDQRYWGSRVLLDTTSGEAIPLHAASEGTVLTLGLMTILYGSHRPRTLLMDDLDRALHPRVQQALVAVLREALQQNPALQIVATSHSPFLLDALEHREVRLTTLADDGSVLCAPLGEHPSFERWKNLVHPGELWSSELEDWLRQPRDAAP